MKSVIQWLVAFLLILGLLGCSGSTQAWKITDADASTQFEIGWGTVVKIGFPGKVRGTAEGEYNPTAPAPTTDVNP